MAAATGLEPLLTNLQLLSGCYLALMASGLLHVRIGPQHQSQWRVGNDWKFA